MVHAWSCSFQKNNHRMAPMMATSPIVQYHPYHQPALSEFILYSATTRKSSFLSLPLPTSTMCYLLQHTQSPTKLHTCFMLQAYHTTHTPALKVMSFGYHKVFQGFESVLFGIHWSMSLFVICSISLPYAFQDNSLYVYVSFCINTQAVVCSLPVRIST